MAYTLEQLRVYVRQHLDLDESEIPNALLDVWARDATIKISRTRKRWPFFEASWTLNTVAGQRDYPLDDFDPDCDEITSIVRNDRRLVFMGRDEAEAAYLPYQTSSGFVTFYNIWGNTLRLYPTVTARSMIGLLAVLAQFLISLKISMMPSVYICLGWLICSRKILRWLGSSLMLLMPKWMY
jgi:hypothetical protein